jgi:8-oxo-dGTP diphosphatase
MVTIVESLGAKKRSGATVNAYLLLKKGERVLLSLRKNTGYFDGCYGLISGHVEDEEPASIAMIREAKEEANLTIRPESLRVVHLMHRKTNRFNIDIFFECASWAGELTNLEPDKCLELNFFSLESPPNNLIPYIGQALRAALHGVVYSEEGWAL